MERLVRAVVEEVGVVATGTQAWATARSMVQARTQAKARVMARATGQAITWVLRRPRQRHHRRTRPVHRLWQRSARA